VPDVVGATTVKLKVAFCPGATDAASSMRCVPHVTLSCAFCEPMRYKFEAVHVAVPVFCIVTETE
jgi:hypothetical protein